DRQARRDEYAPLLEVPRRQGVLRAQFRGHRAGRRGPHILSHTGRPKALAGDRHDLEVSAADGAFEGTDDAAVIVVGPEHVQWLAGLAERDGARARPRTQVLGGSGEVRVRLEA